MCCGAPAAHEPLMGNHQELKQKLQGHLVPCHTHQHLITKYEMPQHNMNEEKSFTFSIASLNTLGIPLLSPYPVERYIALCQVFERLRVDIINLQEVHTYNLFHLLKKNLPSYPYVAYERALPGPKGGLVILSRHPLEKIQFTSFTYPRQIKHALLYASSFIHKKGTLIAKIQGKSLLIYNTHLIPNREGNWTRENKLYQTHEKQLDELSNLIAQPAHKGNYVVVSGDFNIPKNSDLYTHFLDISHAKDIFAADEAPTFHTEFLRSGKQAHRIDYIFLYPKDASISIHSSSLLFQNKVLLRNGKTAYLSDHLGLLAELEIFPM